MNEDSFVPDFIFEGGAEGTEAGRFYTDPDHQIPGQATGVCSESRDVACYLPGANAACTGFGVPALCCTGIGEGTCGGECEPLGESCDLSEDGIRIQAACKADGPGGNRPECCATQLYVIRGTPESGCSILNRYEAPGDPGLNCAVINFGVEHRDDHDCDGVPDNSVDLCPWVTEWDETADADGDGRGDECECGDITGNGLVDIDDILGINAAIFGIGPASRLCSANGDVVTRATPSSLLAGWTSSPSTPRSLAPDPRPVSRCARRPVATDSWMARPARRATTAISTREMAATRSAGSSSGTSQRRAAAPEGLA